MRRTSTNKTLLAQVVLVTVALCLLLARAGEMEALTAPGKIRGYVAYAPGGDHNRCVPDAYNVLKRLNPRGELIGFQYSSAGYTSLAGEDWHIQGIARLPFYSWDTRLRGQFFAAAFSHPMGSGVDYSSHLGVAQMGFKGGKEGKLLGSNRAYNDNWNGNTAEWNVTPNPYDSFISIAGTPKFKIDANENHPGGISTLGWHLVVALEKFHYDFFDCEKFGGCTTSNSNPYVKIYDLWDPGSPLLRSAFLTRNNGSRTNNLAAAITKLSNGKFLLAVTKSTPVPQVEFYVSPGTNLDAPDVFGAPNRLPNATVPRAIWPHQSDWQNMNFITDCSGELFLLGFRGGDDDFIDMYRIDVYEGSTSLHPYYRVHATFWDEKHMYCSDNHNTDQCDMRAAAGSYIDPNGQVVIYSVNFANDGGATKYVYGNGNPWFSEYASHGNYLRGMEFHERHGNHGQGTACPTLADAWVEFYEHPYFNSYGENSGRYYRIDYNERDAKNGKNMATNGFTDKASSIRWCIPPGHSFKFYRDSWSGPYQYLNGHGDVRYIPDLSGYTYAYGGGRTNDSITSYHFHENYVDSRGWQGFYDYDN